MNIYQQLTNEFNQGRVRAILSSGQAVVYHRLALASKDGDWIIREDQEALDHILSCLSGHGARYRLGAPLALPWLAGAWSCHFEFPREGERIRCDFVTRPPRISPESLAQLWVEVENAEFPVLDIPRLIEIKKTRREKDYPVIGELARAVDEVAIQIQESQSPRDLIQLKSQYPEIWFEQLQSRPALAAAEDGEDELEEALFRERRKVRQIDEVRLLRFARAGEPWNRVWTGLSAQADEMPLLEAHQFLLSKAERLLPPAP